MIAVRVRDLRAALAKKGRAGLALLHAKEIIIDRVEDLLAALAKEVAKVAETAAEFVAVRPGRIDRATEFVPAVDLPLTAREATQGLEMRRRPLVAAETALKAGPE